MPLSSVIGSSSIMQPGVCTSTTRPASPYDGQVIYETDTDKTLVWNGTGWVFLSTSRANPVGLDFILTQAIGTAVSSVTVSNVFSSAYDNYLITVNGGSGGANEDLRLQLNGTTSGYYYSITGNTWSGTASNAGSTSVVSVPYMGSITADSINACITVKSPNLSKRTEFSATMMTVSGSYAASGMLNNTTQYTGFVLSPGAGTITGGTISVYGYAK